MPWRNTSTLDEKIQFINECRSAQTAPEVGAEKLLVLRSEQLPHEHWPAISTGDLILKLNGLVMPKRRFRRIESHHPIVKAVFRGVGLPRRICTDNGGRFASAQGLARLTRVSVRFIDLGIDPIYSAPAHSEQNGRHERMHLVGIARQLDQSKRMS